MKYLFETKTTMKPYNRRKWWIDSDVVSNFFVDADTLTDAIQKYREHADDCGVIISDNGIKTKTPMYRDRADGPVQTGFVITGKTSFYDDDTRRCSDQYVELWVEVMTIVDTDFEEKRAA